MRALILTMIVVTPLGGAVPLWPVVGRRVLEKYHETWTIADWQLVETVLLVALCVLGFSLASLLVARSSDTFGARFRFDRFTLPLLLLNCGVIVWGAVLTTFYPDFFALSIQEMSFIALWQELMLLAALIALVAATLAIRKGDHVKAFFVHPAWLSVAMTLAVLILLLEETSYGLHMIGWRTPDAFAANLQSETNLHNFYTHRFELVYYGGAFLCFCILPLVADRMALFDRLGLRQFVPSPGFAVATLPVAGAMFNSWAIVPYQLFFVVAVSIAVIVAMRASEFTRIFAVLVAAVMIGSQAVYLLAGPNLILRFEPTEIRELAICISLAAYAIWLWHSARAPRAVGRLHISRPSERRINRVLDDTSTPAPSRT